MKREFILIIFIAILANINYSSAQEQTAWTWGDNTYGQLGDGTFLGQFVPKQIDNNENWKQVSSGDNHTIAIKNDGTMWAWGLNESGQLGNGTLINRNTPTRIGNQSNWAYVSAGANHNVAIKLDGTIYSWGNNEYGQLGLGNQINANTPTKVGIQTDWKTVQCGGYHTIALKQDGTLWAWGDNEFGQLGDGSYEYKTTPLKIGTQNWSSISAGFQHSLAIRINGTLWGWGDNDYFQLGIKDNSKYYATPFQIGTSSNWKSISAGAWHSMALDNQDELWMWGDNEYGQIGDKTTTTAETPLKLNVSNKWAMVETGTWNSYAIDLDGYLWVWGDNEYFQLGESSVDVYVTEPLKLNNLTNWVNVSGGEYHITTLAKVETLFSISGKVTENSVGINGVEISNGIESRFTNSIGDFIFENLSAMSYTITPISSDYTFTPAFRVVDLSKDEINIDFDAKKILNKFDISGKITLDGAPLADVTVSNGKSITKTDIQGNYTFTDLATDAYTITPSKNGYEFTPNTQVVDLTKDEMNINFTAKKVEELFNISGKVTLNNVGLEGIKINNGDDFVMTNSNGEFIFEELTAASYTITPTSTVYKFSPSVAYITLQQNVSNLVFEAIKIELSVSIFENKALKVYPQPSNGEFSIKLNAEINNTLRIYDVNGLLVFDSKLNRNYKNEDLKIKLDNISNGVYIIELQKGSEIITNNLLIER